MLGSLLLLLAASALVLLAPAAYALRRVGRHRHRAKDIAARRTRLVVAAVPPGLGALVLGAVTGAGVLLSVAAAVILVAAVLAATPRTERWAVRGVVTWALVLVAGAATLLWLLQRLLLTDRPREDLALGGLAWLLALVAVVRVTGCVRALIETRAAATAAADVAVDRRPTLALGGLIAAAGVVLATSSGSVSVPDTDPAPEASRPGAPGPAVGTPTPNAATPTPSRLQEEPTSRSRERDAAARDAAEGPAAEQGPAPDADAPADPEPVDPPAPTATKTPGYEKGKGNRPADAPTPGRDR